MAHTETVSDDMVVSMDYTLRLDSGQVVDSSQGREPLQFIQGQGHIIPGLERELYGMEVGDEKEVTVAPEEGYGERQEDRVQTVPLEAFPPESQPEAGMQVQLQDQQTGRVLQAMVRSVEGETVILDFNHPLAGEQLHFDVEITDVRPATEEELSHGHVHDGQGH